MIVLQKAQSNTFYLTLTEKTTISDAVYLFELTNDLTREVKYVIPVSLNNGDVYNKFRLVESQTENVLEGIVSLPDTGFWSYNVYQQQSTTNLEPDNTMGLVESGKVHVVQPAYSNTQYQNSTDRNYVYSNE